MSSGCGNVGLWTVFDVEHCRQTHLQTIISLHFPFFRLLKVDNNHSEEDSEHIKEKSQDKESRLNSDKEVGVFVLERK